MDVEQARAFIAVAEELHFGHAADRLNMTQPPLSRMIKQLERTYKTQLFERSTRHVSLTPTGAALLGPARALIDAARAADAAVLDAGRGVTGHVRLGFAGASTHTAVGDIVRRCAGRFPDIRVDLHSSQFSQQGLENVHGGSLDMAIGRWDFLPADIERKVITREELFVALPSSHRLADRASVSMSELAEESWVVLPGGFSSVLINRFNVLAKQGGFVPTIRTIALDSWTMLVLVGAGMGVAVTLDSVVDNVTEPNVTFVPLAESNRFIDLQIIWRTGDNNPALRSVLEVVDEVYPS